MAGDTCLCSEEGGPAQRAPTHPDREHGAPEPCRRSLTHLSWAGSGGRQQPQGKPGRQMAAARRASPEMETRAVLPAARPCLPRARAQRGPLPAEPLRGARRAQARRRLRGQPWTSLPPCSCRQRHRAHQPRPSPLVRRARAAEARVRPALLTPDRRVVTCAHECARPTGELCASCPAPPLLQARLADACP